MDILDVFVDNFFDETIFDHERKEALRYLFEEVGVVLSEEAFETTKEIMFSVFNNCYNLGYADGRKEGYEEGFNDGFNDYNVK